MPFLGIFKLVIHSKYFILSIVQNVSNGVLFVGARGAFGAVCKAENDAIREGTQRQPVASDSSRDHT